MQPATRKQVANAILAAYPSARISWTGEAQIITLFVATAPGADERYLTIESAYASSPERVAALIEDVLDMLR